jgi:hypothetical protein
VSAKRTLLLGTSLLAAATALAFGGGVAPALALRAVPPSITPAGVGLVKLGERYRTLRAANLIGTLRGGCELAGPGARSARLHAPLRGSVDFTQALPRKVTTIVVFGGATARGVGVGASAAQIRRRFPAAVFDHGTDAMFGVTLVTIPKSGGGKLQFALEVKTGKVTEIGVPSIPFCE